MWAELREGARWVRSLDARGSLRSLFLFTAAPRTGGLCLLVANTTSEGVRKRTPSINATA